MIDLYSLATPNGQKIGIALEEMELEYEPHLVDITKGMQFRPEFVAINPNSKIPAIIDRDGPDGKELKLFESGAILMYLAEKSGRFMPQQPRQRYEILQWLFFQVGGIGPMFGQYEHFHRFAGKDITDPYPLKRYADESKRLVGVLDQRLSGRQFITGSYSIADMACFPWVNNLRRPSDSEKPLDLHSFTNVNAWLDRCLARPAVQRGVLVCKRVG